MNKGELETLNFKDFVSQYMRKGDREFFYKQSPIQIYPLSIAHSFIKSPTALFKADYTFILLFIAGGGEQQIDGEIYSLKPYDVLFVREGHLNGIKLIDPKTEEYFIYLDYVVLPMVFDDKNLLNYITFNPKHTISKERMEWAIKCCDLIADQKSNSSHSNEIKKSLLRAIILMFAEQWTFSDPEMNRMSQITLSFKEKLFDGFMLHRDVKFYADLLSVSQNYLNRSVKSASNKSPKQHINEIVINHSQILLQDTSKSISEVAYELNFADASHFGRLFKQVANKTPTEYRNAIMHDLSE